MRATRSIGRKPAIIEVWSGQSILHPLTASWRKRVNWSVGALATLFWLLDSNLQAVGKLEPEPTFAQQTDAHADAPKLAIRVTNDPESAATAEQYLAPVRRIGPSFQNL